MDEVRTIVLESTGDQWEDMLNSEEEYAPGVDKLTMDSPAPVQRWLSGLERGFAKTS